MTIKPIETEYAGHRFRSRLEARWAVFFDKLGLRWHYEEEGYELPSGRYLPDFRLERAAGGRDLDLWCEVKGRLDHRGTTRLIRAALELERRVRSGPSPQILVLGEVPPPGQPWTHVRIDTLPGAFALQSVHFGWWPHHDHPGWATRPVGEAVWGDAGWLDVWTENESFAFTDLLTGPTWDPYLTLDPAVDNAFRAARSARFEFGQSGATL